MMMRKILIICTFCLLAIGTCFAQNGENSVKNYGKSMTADGAVDVAEIPELMTGKDSLQVKVTGSVVDVCQMRGCWMTLRIDDETTVRVRFKDYAFFVPKDISGKTAVVQGVATRRTVPVDELRHLAGDEGKSQAEIDAIKAPAEEWTMTAEGVLIQ